MAAPKKKQVLNALPEEKKEAGRTIVYRALESCRVGHFRSEGDVFSFEEILPTPDYLEIVDGDEDADDGKRDTAQETSPAENEQAAPGGTLADIYGVKE